MKQSSSIHHEMFDLLVCVLENVFFCLHAKPNEASGFNIDCSVFQQILAVKLFLL